MKPVLSAGVVAGFVAKQVQSSCSGSGACLVRACDAVVIAAGSNNEDHPRSGRGACIRGRWPALSCRGAGASVRASAGRSRVAGGLRGDLDPVHPTVLIWTQPTDFGLEKTSWEVFRPLRRSKRPPRRSFHTSKVL